MEPTLPCWSYCLNQSSKLKTFLGIMLIALFSVNSQAQSNDLCDHPDVTEGCEIYAYEPGDHAVWLPSLPGSTEDFIFGSEGGAFRIFNDGTAHISGTIERINNSNKRWVVDVWLKNKRTWAEWSALGRDYKDEQNFNTGEHVNWYFYEMDNDNAVLTGEGDYAGSTLYLQHMPADYEFGFQFGLGANSKNLNFGFSGWFTHTGTYTGHGDFNVNADCTDCPEISCELFAQCSGNDVTTTGGNDGSLTALVDGSTNFSVEWTGPNGFSASTQTINDLYAGCYMATITDIDNPNCTYVLECAVAQPADCEEGPYRTQTPGGWGAPASGNNPGAYRDANFAGAFPAGLTVGCPGGFNLNLTSAAAVQAFLPSGGTPAALTQNYTDPGNSLGNTFAGHLVALTLSIGFDNYDPNFASPNYPMEDLFIDSGDFAGMTVAEFLEIANDVFGGCSNAFSPSQVTGTLTDINESYVDGQDTGSILECSPPQDECVGELIVFCIAIAEVEIDCTESTHPDNTGYASFQDPYDGNPNCPEIDELIWEDDVNGSCPTIITRTWILSDTDGNTATCEQTITINDTEAPEFDSFPSDLEVECPDDVPELGEITASDNCDDDVTVVCSESFQSQEGSTNCELINMDYSGESAPRIGWLQQMPGTVNPDKNLFTYESGLLERYDDGTARLYGVMSSINNDQLAWEFDVYLTGGYTWAEWSAMGRDYKDDQNIAGSNYEDWIYYEVDGSMSTLTGIRDYAGSLLNLTHAPTDFNYGFQLGQNANVFTETFGMSGWFLMTGQIHYNGNVHNRNGVMGDFNLDLDCEEPNFQNECVYTIVRTCVATDECGNSTTATQTIVVEDTTPPVITCLEDLTVDCFENVPEPNIELVDAFDNCSDVTITWEGDEVDGEFCEGQVLRTYRATDECGNYAECVQTITYEDNEAPVFEYEPQDITVECGQEYPSMDEIPATDNCDDNVTITMASSISLSDDCPTIEIITRSWTATDACENSTTITQTIYIQDTGIPTITCPDDIEVECYDDVPEPNVQLVMASDDCSDVVVTWEGDEMDGDECSGTIIRTYRATDACGNYAECTQSITYEDTEAPVLLMPADTSVTAYCGFFQADDAQDYLNGNMTPADSAAFVAYVQSLFASQGLIPVGVEDNCDPNAYWEEISIEILTDVQCPLVYQINCNFQAFDACGNESEIETTYLLIEDDQPPVITCPDDIQVQCYDDVPEPNVQLVVALDECSDVIVTWEGDEMDGDDCSGTVIRTYRATDECGNYVECTQTITYEDTEAPVFEYEPQDLTIECGDEVPPMEEIPVTDNCDDNVTITLASSISISDDCPTIEIISRSWTATDNCGNSTTVSQTVYIQDTGIPTITCPDDIEVQCLDDVPAPNVQLVSASDDCSDVVVTWEGDVSEGDECTGTILRTYRATDACGNYVECTQTITYDDTEAPVFETLPTDITIDCTEEIPAPENLVVSDNCDFFDLVITEEGGPGSDDDNCGQYRTQTPGGWGAPASGDNPGVYRDANFAGAFPGGLVIGCETGFQLTLTSAGAVEAFLPSGGTPSVLTQNWIDPAGNVSNTFAGHLVAATLSLTFDSYDPDFGEAGGWIGDLLIGGGDFAGMTVSEVIAIANDVIGGCSNAYSAEALTGVLTTINENYVDGNTDNGDLDCTPNFLSECEYVIIRTYTAIDVCGNESSVTQTITVVDDTPPVIVCPDDITISCFTDLPVADINLVEAFDNCTDVVVTWEGDEVIGDFCVGIVERTYRATDECGNYAECVQIINYNDEEAPVFEYEPQDLTLECGEAVPPMEEIPATDNCDPNPVVTLASSISISEDCPAVEIISRSWTATDACGNSTTINQTITIQDTGAPTIDCPDNIEVECYSDVPEPNVQLVVANDECSDVVVTWEGDEMDGDECSGIITRTYRATDACGNYAECTQLISYSDDEAPVFEYEPQDLTIQCGDQVPPMDEIPATDNCDPDVEITLASSIMMSEDCPVVEIITRSWTATDNCGNSTTISQTIYVEDNEGPSIACAPGEHFDCETDIPEPDVNSVEASDDCSDVVVTWEGDVTEGDECEGTVTRTYRATDACGNYTECTQVFTYEDTEAPVIDGDFEDFTVECIDDIPPFEGCTATDNCTEDVQVWSFEFPMPNADIDCELTDAIGPGVDWSIVLFNFPGATDYYVFDTPGSMQIYNDGSAIITGTVQAINNPAQQWEVFIRLENERDWDEWSALGRDYKDDLSLAGMNYLDWSYYEVDNNNSFLIGAGDFAGSFLQLSHMPASYLFGFQCGLAANNKNANFGLSGWFEYNGLFNGQQVSGMGDVNVDKECEENNLETECVFEVERFCIAVDDCGNTTVANQTITVEDTTPPEFTVTPEDLFFECYDDVPEPDASQLEAVDNCGGPVVIAFADDVLIGTECEGVISRSYDAIDECGNLTKYIQNITIADTLAPVLNGVPTDLELSCEEEVPAPANVTATDNCDTMVNVIFSEMSEEGNCPQNFVITRTWTASDSCGNEVSATQIINITDETAPVITECPEDAHYDCIDDVPAPNTELVSATDNCGMVSIVHVGDVQDGDECEGTITRTYRATDECGNSSDCVQVITYNDDVAPVFVNAPGNTEADCDNIPNPADVVATDNCSEVTIEFSETLFSGGCAGVLQRIWVATDACGNSTTHEQFISLIDTVAPVLSSLPADATYECDEDVPGAPEVWATDNCDEDIEVEFTENVEMGDCPQSYTITRTWTATDECNNTVSHTQTITIQDTTAPVFNIEDNEITISCDTEIAIDTPVATDNCDSAPMVELVTDSIGGDCPNEWTEVYTWTATDACGNSSSVSLTINYVDDEAPEFTEVPEDLFFDCIEDVPAANVQLLSAIDNCGDVIITHEGDTQNGDDCEAVISRTYRATDECGNYTEYVQSITVADTLAPVLAGVPASNEVSCDNIPEPAVVTATDNCDDAVNVIFSEMSEEGECPQSYTIIRTWTATDSCGNTATASQSIFVFDNVAPVITECPADEHYDCIDDLPAPNTELVSATDNCGMVSIVHVGDVQDGDECEGTITRTYRATDECGNSADCVQVITYNDDVAPVFVNAPENITVDCADVPDPMEVTATDNCSEVTIEFSEIEFSGGCPGVLERTWVATDECGNSATHIQYINLIDTVAPTLHNLPADATYECDEEIPAPAEVTATDNCDADVIVNFEESTEAGDCPQEYTIYRTWTATDTCENSVSHTQVINIVDTTAPVFDAEDSEITVACDEEVEIATPMATDNCDSAVQVEMDMVSIDGECANEWTEIYTWTATDACGNSSSVSLTINYVDDEAPEFTEVPEDLFFDCIEDVPAANVQLLSAIDNCGDVIITHEGDTQNGDDCEAVISRTYRATDECGNYTEYVQSITVADTLAPVLAGVPASNEVSCDNIPEPAVVTATDNCDDAVNVIFSEMSEEGDCPQSYTIIRTWTATDSCGNTASATQNLWVYDNVAPVITECPADEHYDCIDDLPAPNTELVSATDNCGLVSIVHVGDVQDGDECEGTITRTYRATDECGNSADCVQVITYNDDVAPVFVNAPENITVDCADVPDPMEVTATDNCSEVTIEFSEIEFSGGCPGVLERTWVATDECGNSATHIQYINLIDTVAPTLHNLPADATYECDEEIPAPAEVTATDNCDADVIVNFEESTEAGDCPQEYTIYRTWTATDTCENSVSHTQVINIVDTTAPVFDTEDSEITVACDEVVEIVAPMATDNCDSAPMVELVTDSIGGDCPNEWTEVYTWTATDACGNSSSVSLTINYVDDEAPEFTEVPEDLFFDCIEDVPAANVQLLSAIDNCGDVIITHEGDMQDGDDCEAVISRTYRATDECGNYTEYVQSITVADTLAPVLAGVPIDTEASCDDIPEVANVTASDNCDDAVNVIFSEMSEEGECPQSYTIIRTWTATDSCGNTATASQSIFVFDNVAPVITECPADEHYDCIDDVPAPNTELVSATDNCGMVSIVHVGDVQDGDECEGTITRTYRATDECGNSADCVQVITYNDDVAPVFVNAPGNTEADCDNIPNPADVVATDNCSEVTIEFSETLFSGGCAGVLQRIWVATDACGNSTTHEQFISLIDTVAPVLSSLPADATYECDEDVPGAPEVWATDNCDEDIEVEFTENVEMGDCPQSYTITRTWTATDECNNTVSHTQTITIQDTTAPVFNIEDNEITISCDTEIAIDTPVATDNCDSAVNVDLDITEIEGECANEWTVVYTWTATDACGNSSSVSLTVNYIDEVAPEFTEVPEDLFFDCIEDVPAANVQLLSAIDNCGDVIITHEGDMQDGDDCEAVISRTYRATDECGNYTEYVQSITVADTLAPVLAGVPASNEVSCDNIPEPAVVTATDNCDDAVNVIFSEMTEEGECPQSYTIIRTWTATDSCGNTATASQSIFVFDNVAPVITECPEDEHYDCIDDVPAPNTELVSAIDNCGIVSITHIGDQVDGDECEGTIIRTYRATDECGNSADCVQVITYNDDVAPVFVNAPGNTEADCDNIPDPAEVIAEDNCSEVTIEFSETLFSGGCAGVLQRIWVATDACGNSTTHEQFITLIDTVAPVLSSLPADATYECDEDVPGAPEVWATDNCDMEVEVEFTENVEMGDCPQSYTIIRTWTATDECDNTVSHTQTITIQDTTAPVFNIEDNEITISCDTEIAIDTPVATDNCDSAVNVELDITEIEGECANEWTVVYTWTATDACGNSASVSLTVNYIDEVAPEFTEVPEDLFFECIEDVPAADTGLLAAVDNCGDVTITHEGDMQEGDDCSAAISRTYRATDACGNYTEYVQTITVADTLAPWFNESVEDMTVECDMVPEPATITASDNCDANVDVAFDEQMEDGECEGSYTLIRTWTATDNCGNGDVLVQVITVEDNTAPVFVDAPEDATYHCNDEIPEMETPMAVDNCSSTITYTAEEFIEGYTGEDGLANCDLTTPLEVVGATWALWLPNSIGEPQYYHLTPAGGQFIELPNGRAHLTGTVYAPSNPDKRWVIDVYFKDRADWNEWGVNLERGYKDDANVAGDNYLDWDYYILNADSATLSGDGLYAGSELSLSHAPASYFFGFQVGEAANNRNAADGMSGWFFYNGQWIGNEGVNGIGDFSFEKECPECDYTITRIWTATDDCGNTATAMQVITVVEGPDENENLDAVKPVKAAVVLAAWPNPTAHRSTITFEIPENSRVVLEVFNMDGKLIETLYQGEANASQEYFFNFEAGSLANGIYLYKLTTENEIVVDKLMISK